MQRMCWDKHGLTHLYPEGYSEGVDRAVGRGQAAPDIADREVGGYAAGVEEGETVFVDCMV